METPSLPIKKRRLKHALATLALFTALAALPSSAQTSSGETNPQPPMPPLWSLLEDADQDGMTDVDELVLGMDPFNPEDGLSDLDGDDIELAWEFAIGTNPAEADTDTDGWSDSEEYLLYGTDPLDLLSFPLGDTPASGVDTALESSIPEAEAALPEPTPPPSLFNGDFSSVEIITWKSMLTSTEYQGKGFVWNAGTVSNWTAYAGSTVEVWDAGGEKFVELDGSPGNYGIKQPITNAKAGGYVLAWRESGRNSTRAGTDPYCMRVYYMNGTSEVKIAQSKEFTGFSKTQWADNAFGFQITSEQLATAGKNPIYVAFIPTGNLNTYGTLIDKVRLLPVDITVRKKSVTNTPSKGLCVKKGIAITFDFNGAAPASEYPLADSTVKWKICQIQQDGSLTPWSVVPGEGCELDYTTSVAGIFQVKAQLTLPGQAMEEFIYQRKKNVENAKNSEGEIQALHLTGAPEYFGVVDKNWQLYVRDHSVASLGSTYYAEAKTCEIYAGMHVGIGLSKCNIFVYHKCNAGGAKVPLVRDSSTAPFFNTLPPNAIDWNGTVIDWFGNENPADEAGNLVSNQREIPNWVSVPRSTMPQPGWVVTRAQAWSTAAYPVADPWLYHSHVGIMDYDGSWVNAGSKTVNKYCHLKTDFYQPARFKSYNTP